MRILSLLGQLTGRAGRAGSPKVTGGVERFRAEPCSLPLTQRGAQQNWCFDVPKHSTLATSVLLEN